MTVDWQKAIDRIRTTSAWLQRHAKWVQLGILASPVVTLLVTAATVNWQAAAVVFMIAVASFHCGLIFSEIRGEKYMRRAEAMHDEIDRLLSTRFDSYPGSESKQPSGANETH